MNIGYACIALGVEGAEQKTCIMRNVSEKRLLELVSQNLFALDNIIEYNYRNNIKLFRISSEIIPFGSSPVNTFDWKEAFKNELSAIGKKIKAYGIRVSMHPGQYTILNSPSADVVERAIAELSYQSDVLNALNTSYESKLILHIGGIYGDKKSAMDRFKINFGYLDEKIAKRIAIENDDRLFGVADALEISSVVNAPVIYDILHNNINPSDPEKDDNFWLYEVNKTWKNFDGVQKIHYAEQEHSKHKGAHSSTIDSDNFLNFYNNLNNKDIDVMLEVKDKNLSAVRCMEMIEK